MAHPFERMFEKALKKSSADDNLVSKEARNLIGKGYKREEVCAVLIQLKKSLIAPADELVIQEAYEEVCGEEEE